MHTHCINYDESIRAVAKRLISNNFSGTSLAGTRETDEFFSTGIVCDGEKASFSFSQLPDPDDTCDSGNLGAQMYTLDDCVVFIDTCDGDALYIAPPGTDMLDYLLLWDMGDMDASEFLAQFGYDDYVDEADDTDTDVRIWVQPNYYQGQCNAPIAHYLVNDNERGDHDDHRIFATYSDAQAWIDDTHTEVYCTSNGEAGRPAYMIVK